MLQMPQWDGVENKPAVAAYAGGAVVALWLSSTLVGAINYLPLIPKILELVGLGYTAWFVYRYLLFKARPSQFISSAWRCATGFQKAALRTAFAPHADG